MRAFSYSSIVSRLMVFAMAMPVYFVSMTAAASETLNEIYQIETEASRALAGEQFAQLNAMADGLRASKERLPDGRWKLTFVTTKLSDGLPKGDERAWRARLRLMDKWIAKTPTNATPYLAKAIVLIDYAWDARGTGYASDVKDSDWPLFRQRIAQARKVLERSAAISKHSPLWYQSMQTIATAQAWPEEDFLRLFREGVREEPTYYFLYFSAANYLLPRWHGSATRLAEFVDEAVAATEQQEGQTLYARIYWSLLGALQDNTFSPDYASWPRMRQGFEDVVRVYPDNWNLNAFTYYACMAGDWQTAKATSARITAFSLEIWKTPFVHQNCMQHASGEPGGMGAPPET